MKHNKSPKQPPNPLSYTHGQVTAFIALALLMLLIFASLIVITVWQAKTPTSQPIQRAGSFDAIIGDITNYVQSCIAKEAAPIIISLAEHGGRLEPTTEIFFNGTKIHPLCANQNRKEGCVSTLTTRASLEMELKGAVMNAITDCINIKPQFASTGAQITTERPELNASITIDAVHFTLSYQVRISLGPNHRELTIFTSTVDTPLGRMFGTALDITNAVSKDAMFDKEDYMANHDTSILIEAHRPYPHTIYQLRRHDPRLGQDFLFQFAIQGKDTAGKEPLYLDPKHGCCYANDNTYHYNARPEDCARIGKYEDPGCGVPANAAPVVEGCCVRSDNQCSITTKEECGQGSGQGNTFYENDRLCSQAPGCTSLDCPQTYSMPTRTITSGPRKNGESWCIYDGRVGNGNDLVGSRHYVHSCVRGREYVEPCRDYREELCAEERRSTIGGAVLAHAACRINRFADCTRQGDPGSCADAIVRDCEWMPGVYSPTPTYTTFTNCIPTTAPGLPFWEGQGDGICKQGSNSNSAKPKKKQTFGYQAAWACQRIGDCGPKFNIADTQTLGGYWNPDGAIDASKLLPAGSTRQQYPGLPLSVSVTKISPGVIASPDILRVTSHAGGDATCGLWQQPGSGDCRLCASNPYWQPCTEYRCKSIGANCNWNEIAGIGTCTGPEGSGAAKPRITVLKQGDARIESHEPWPIEISIDQKSRCAIRAVSRSYSKFTSSTWGICLSEIIPANVIPTFVPPGFLETQCVTPPTIHLSDGKFDTHHQSDIRFPSIGTLLSDASKFIQDNNLPQSWDATIKTFLRNGFKLYLTCTSEQGIPSDQVEFPVVLEPERGQKPPQIIEIHPKQHEMPPPDGSTRDIIIYADRPFQECTVKPEGLPEIRISCPETQEQDQKFGIYQPPGSYECAGGQLILNAPKFTFQCRNEHGAGIPYQYKVGSLG